MIRIFTLYGAAFYSLLTSLPMLNLTDTTNLSGLVQPYVALFTNKQSSWSWTMHIYNSVVLLVAFHHLKFFSLYLGNNSATGLLRNFRLREFLKIKVTAMLFWIPVDATKYIATAAFSACEAYLFPARKAPHSVLLDFSHRLFRFLFLLHRRGNFLLRLYLLRLLHFNLYFFYILNMCFLRLNLSLGRFRRSFTLKRVYFFLLLILAYLQFVTGRTIVSGRRTSISKSHVSSPTIHGEDTLNLPPKPTVVCARNRCIIVRICGGRHFL